MENDAIKLSVAVYGKQTPSKGMPQGYTWLFRDPGIPADVFAIADSLAGSFQWVSGPDSTEYAAVTCWLPVNNLANGGLYLRFRDAGADEQGRPHTVRVEAAYIGKTTLSENPTLPFVLLSDSDQLRILSGLDHSGSVFRLNSATAERLSKALGGGDASLRKTVMVTPTPIRFRVTSPPDVIMLSAGTFEPVSLQQSTCTDGRTSVRQFSIGYEGMVRMPPSNKKRSSIWRVTAYVFVALFVVLLCAVILYQHEEIEALRTSINTTNLEMLELTEQFTALEEDYAEAQSAEREMTIAIDNLTADNDSLREDNARLRLERAALEEDVDEATRIRLERLELLRDAVAKARNPLRAHMNALTEQGITLNDDHPYRELMDRYDEAVQGVPATEIGDDYGSPTAESPAP